MPKKIGKAEPPQGFSRLVWRAPIWIYRLGLGGVIKSRMLLLRHIGRKTGLPRQNVLEIVDYNQAQGIYYVASGFGKKADWYRNILAHPEVEIVVGRKVLPVTAVPLAPDDSGQALIAYAHRNPRAAKSLMRICGYAVDGSDEDYMIMGRDIIPIISFIPRSPEQDS